MGLSEVKKVLR